MPTSDIAYTPILHERGPRPRVFSHAVVVIGTGSTRIAGQVGRASCEAHIGAGTDAGTQGHVAPGNVVAVSKAGGEPGHLATLRAYVTDVA